MADVLDRHLALIVTDSDVGLGCGKFFEGTASEMHSALNNVLASLPDDTRVFVCRPSPSEDTWTDPER